MLDTRCWMLNARRRKSGVDVRTTTPSVWIGGLRVELLCLSGEEASFLVGGEIPVVKVTSSAAGDTVAEDVEYKEYGVKLNIQPIVLKGGDIKLNLTTEVKELSSEGQYIRTGHRNM